MTGYQFYNKNMFSFLLPVVIAFTIITTSFLVYYNNKKTKYPSDFPVACIEYFDKFHFYVKKMETSKRFDKETLSAFEWFRKLQISKIIKNYRVHSRMDDKKINCFFAGSEFFSVIDNMDNLTKDELEKLLSLKDIKGLYISNRNRLKLVILRF